MAQRKKKQQTPKGVVYLIAFICIVCLGYGPLERYFSDNRENITEVLKEGVENAKKEYEKAKKEYKETQKEYEETKAEANASRNSEENPFAGARLELPSALTDRPEQILQRCGYTVSFNKKLNLPNWVAWELNPEKMIERESRTDKFLPDPDLPESEAVTTSDYTGSGYDRGHMCPAGDNRWHWRAMQESFYMTNICPQNHNLNRGDWKELEEKCRRWAQEEEKIYIVCGPVLYDQRHKRIGKEHKVTVPEAFFKVILSMKGTPKAIGFIYKNTSGNHPLDSYVNSVDEVERITGIDFFPALPDDVEKEAEASYDLKQWK